MIFALNVNPFFYLLGVTFNCPFIRKTKVAPRKVRHNLVNYKRNADYIEPIPRLDIGFSSQYQNLILISNYLGVNINCPFIRKSKVAPRKVRQNLVKDQREMKHQDLTLVSVPNTKTWF